MAQLEGNVYVDPSYTAEITGTTYAATGEVLEFGVNAFAEGGTTSNVPVEGGTIFFNNLDRLGSSIYNDGTYDMVLINTRSNYLYAVPKVANQTYSRDITVYVEGGTHQHLALLGRSGNVKLIGDLTFTAKNVNFGTENDNMGGGDSNFSDCLILGNITFNVSDITTGGSFYVHCGTVGSEDQKVKVKGTVTNFQSTSAFRGIRTGNGRGLYGDFELTVTGSSFGNSLELGYVEAEATWEGTYTMTVTSSTAANIYAFENATSVGGEHTFTLNVAAGEKATQTAVVYNFNTINVANGATLTVTGFSGNDVLNLNLGAKITATNLDDIKTINVIGDLVQSDTVIISGLTVTNIDAQIFVGDREYTAGKFPGFYEIVNGDLILHSASSTVLLVNSNYTNGAATGLGPVGYKTLADAQVAVTDPATTSIMITSMDTDVDPSSFTEALVTKDFTTVLDGNGDTLDIQGQDLVIGDTGDNVETANVTVSYTDNINKISIVGVNTSAIVGIDNSGANGTIGTLDLTGTAVKDAQVTVDTSVIGDILLSDQAEAGGKLTVKNSTITNVYGAAGGIENDLTGANEIEYVFAEANGDKIKLAGSHVGQYMAGLSQSGASLDTLVYNDGVTADTLIIGGNANTYGKIDATFTGGGSDALMIGGDGDTVTGDIDVTIKGGKFASAVVAENAASVGGKITVTLAGGTVAPMNNGQVINGSGDTANSFPGLVYGASVTGLLSGGDKGTSHELIVEGNAKVGSVSNFESLKVTGGTLNVAGGGGHDSVVSESNSLEIDGDIENKRAISAGRIFANNIVNTGLIGTKRDAESYTSTGIWLNGSLSNEGYVKTSGMSIAGNLFNSGKISATGGIYVQGNSVINDGELFIRSAFSREGVFTQDGGLNLSGTNFTNTGFVSVGSLTGVNNLTTSKMYVTGGAEITGNITIEAGAEVAFTNKANDSIANGLTLGGSITMADTSVLVVSGDLSTSGTKTITVNVGDLIGSNEIVHAEGGVNAWTIKLTGAKAGLYEYAKTDTSVVIYSLDQLFVNSSFSADADIVVDGNKLVFGKNAFASVADAVAAAKSGAKIVIAGDKTGMDVAAAGFDVELNDAVVGDVTAKTVSVTSDSKVNSIVSASSLEIDAGAVLSVTETIPTALHIVIDAEEGSGSRLVLDVDPTKVPLSLDNVVILGPAGKAYTAMILAGEGETAPAHAGDLYLVSQDNVYFIKDNPAFVDGDTFDKATGDALFANVNVFATREAAEAKAAEVGGVLYLVGFSTGDGQKGSSNVATAFEFSGGGSGLYCTDGSSYTSNEDHTTILAGTSITTNVYGLNKYVNTTGDFDLIVNNSSTGTFYITGATNGTMDGDITATITNSNLGSTYIGYGNFGTDEDAPISIDITVQNSRLGAFFGINTDPGNMNPEARQDINADINIKIYDSVIGGTFTVLNTNNEHWNGNGASLLQTYFTAGSINVEIGGSSIADNIRTGLSLELAGKAPQAFNVANTLHIVATDNSTVTNASYLCEWDTIIVDATAQLFLNTLQYTTTAIYLNGQTDDVLDGRSTLTQVMINMSGYESGTHQVIKASNEIYTDSNLSNITVIGDNDLTGQCQLAYTYSNAEETVLNGIYVFDKSDDMYVNTSYNATVSGTTSASGQELLFGYNAHTDFEKAIFYANDWDGTIVVTGGNFEAQDFEGNNVDFQNGTIGAITMGNAKAGTLTVSDSAKFTTADGSGVATIEIDSNAKLGAVSNFSTVKFAADAEITAASFDLSGAAVVIDVDGFTGSSHIVLTAEGGLSGFDASKFSFVGEDADKYSVLQQGNSIVLKSAIQSNTYVNSAYTAEITGTILEDGTYLEYGFNAFSTLAEGAAALGGADDTLTVTGGSFAEDFELATGNLALVDGVVIDGMVTGNGKNTISIDGNVTVSTGIEAIGQITLTTTSLLTTDYIELGGGKVYVTGSAAAAKEGNLTKVISTKAGVSGAELTGDPGFYVYAQGNDVYILDLTRIYVDPTFTEAVTGTTTSTGDTLVWGVNAFHVASNVNLADANNAEAVAVNNALVSGGTLFISNWGTAGAQAGDVRTLKDVSIVAQGPTNFSIVFGNNGGAGHVVNDDITITVDNTSTPQGSTAFIHSNSNDARWTFNGNVTVNFVGSGPVHTNTGFAVTNRVNFGPDATLTLNLTGQTINNDFTPFRNANNGAFDSLKKVTINFTNVYGPSDKWLRLFSNGDGTGDNFTGTSLNAKDVELNITDSYFQAGNNNWSIALTNGAEGSRNTNYTINLSGATVDGLISGVRNRDQNSPGNGSVYEGTRTVNVSGAANRLARLIMINHLVVDANTTLTLTDINGSYGNNVAYALHFIESNSSGQNSITIDVSNYEGADKMVVTAPRMGIAQRDLGQEDVVLNLVGDTEGKFAVGLGLTKGVFIITKNGDILYNSEITTASNGTAFGNTFVLAENENANAFGNYDEAKAAMDARIAAGSDAKFFVSGNGNEAFYADGYAVTIIGGTYENGVYGSDSDGATVASVDLTITDGQFFEVAASDGNGSVTGDATIELAGGKFGIPAVYETPEATEDDPNPEPELVEDEVPATISGSKDYVGGTSTLVVSKDLTVAGDIEEFDAAFVNANLTVTGDFEADTITIDASKLLTVEGDITATSIIIDATAYDGPTKALVVSDSLESAQPAVTINGDLEVYDYRYVEDTLYLVSKNAGNVYLNSTWDESISGTIYNGELLVWGVNAFGTMETAQAQLTEDYTLFITGGVFADTYTFGKATIRLLDDGVSIGGLVLGDGSTLTIAGTTSGANSIGSIAAVEGYTSGINIVANSETAFGTLGDVRSFTFTAGQGISVNGITYRENGGYLTVDFKGYTNGSGVLLQTIDGINGFLKYDVVLDETTTVSRTVVGAENNPDKMMPYYDETKKAVIGVEANEFAFLDKNASDADNGTVVTIDGKTGTKVYGYNTSEWNVNSGRYTISGGTLFADGGETGAFYWFFTAEPVNVNITGLTCGGGVAGYNDDNPGQVREGDFTVYAEGSSFGWFTAFAGQGTEAKPQVLIVSNREYNDPDDPDSGYYYVDGTYNLTFKGGTHDTNAFYVSNYAKISGGTANISFIDYRLAGDLRLFYHTYKNDGENLKEINVVFDNVTAPAAKWCCVLDPRDVMDTKITMTVTNSTFTGTDHTLGFIDNSTNGGWSGEGEFYISGFTMQGRLSGARGRDDQGDISNITGFRTLFVDGDNYVRVVRDFSRIDVSADAGLFRTEEVRLSDASDIILRGEENYTGPVKEYIVASGTVTGILRNSAQFVDENGAEIDGYAAAIGDRSVFIYKTDGDVFFDADYTEAINGTTITDADGQLNYLVFGDNAVATYALAMESADKRTDATIQIENTVARDFYTRGYRVSVNGGRITNLNGGNAPGSTTIEVEEEVEVVVDGVTTTEMQTVTKTVPVAADSVSSVDITVTSGATISNITIASEYSQVSGDALLTIDDDVVLVTASTNGVIDGGLDYVGGVSTLVFLGDATAKAITGFDSVVLDADGLVELTGAFSGTSITIDAKGFEDATKKVLVAEGGFGDTTAITVTVINGAAGIGYEFLDDGKTLVLTSPLVSDTFVNTAWTEADVHNKFAGDTALVWGKNAFASVADAAAAIGEDGTLNLEGGASSDAIVLANDNDVVVSADFTIGSITSGGDLYVDANFTADALSGFGSIDLTAGKTITVSGGIELAADSEITIDVTGYSQEANDVVVISTGTGIANIDTAVISVEGETDKIFYAYYDEEGGDVHLMRIDNFYVDVAYGTAGENIEPGQTNPITGERLIWGVNAFYYLNNGLNAMKPGQCLYINGRAGNNINTGDRMGNIYITDSTVPVLINGYTTGDQVYNGDVWLTVENSTFATAAGTYLFGNVGNALGNPWEHNQHILGNMTVNVIGSTVGGDTGAILVTGINYVNVLGTADEAATITFNFVDSIIRDDMLFIGDSPIGKDETFQGVTRKGANLVINMDNVVVPQDKWWRIQGGDQQSQGTVTVNIKDSTIGGGDGSMRFALDDNWGTGWGATPRSASDFIFNLDNSNVVGYLVAGRLNYDELGDTYTGAKTLNLTGDNAIRYTYWFKEVNLAAGATLTGRVLRLASAGGTINVDITGYTGKSKVIVSMDNAFENVANITVTGAEGSDYQVLTSDRAIVIKGAVKDLYVNSTYTAETCPAGTVYNGELLFFGENAFATLTEAVPALTDDAVIYVTGGENELGFAALATSISIDATATMSYSGADVITIAGDLVNDGIFTISAAAFVEGAPAQVTVLTATSISGDGSFATDSADYMIKVVGNEVHLVQKKADVFVNTDWEGLADGTEVTIGDITAEIGLDAYATADAAAASVGGNGSITVVSGEVNFSSAILTTVVAMDSSVIQNTAVGTGTGVGSLTLQSGAVASNISVRGKGVLTVEAGATVTGGLGMLKGAAVSFAEGSVLDFDITGTTVGSSALVTNFSLITGAPSFTITLAADQAEGEYLLADDAAAFAGNVTLMIGSTSIGTVSTSQALTIGQFTYTLAITDNSELSLSVEEGELPDVPTFGYVNSEWAGLEDGATVTIGTISATIGYDAFATLAGGIAGVTDDGFISVVGGEVSFADGYSKTITVEDGATVIGTAVFDAAITVNGTIAFNTADATAEAAQFGGFSFVSGDTKYTLTDANPTVGTYLLAADAAAFTGSVVFGEATLTVGAEAVQVGDFTYAIGITDNSELALTVAEYVPPTPTTPTHVYVSSEWAGFEDGAIVTFGDVTAKIGYDAFATLAAGIAGVTDDGSVEVVSGEVSFADGYYKTITVDADATVVGTASFLNKPITIDGTIAFDVALTTRTTAQIADIQFVSGDTKYTLTVDNPTVGTYMLASGLWYDDLYQPVFNGSIIFGDTVLTVGNDVTVGDFTYGLRTTGWLDLMLVIDKVVPPSTEPFFITASLNGVDNMIGRAVESETAGIQTDITFYWLNGEKFGLPLAIEEGWTYAGIGDFDGDGIDGILRYNTTNGLVVSDNANGNGTFTPQVLNLKDASWDILGTGDFNGDGKDDVLVANATASSSTIGLLGYWAGGTDWTLINGYSDEWTLVDTGDYDGNGSCDMLWKNSFVGEGGLTYNAYCTWRLGDIEGVDWSIVMVAKVSDTGTDTDAWSYLTTGDFNGDGIADIAMINDVGTVAVATMAANGSSSAWTVLSVVDTSSWNLAGTADLNVDGVDDIIWCQSATEYGSLAGYWQINADEYNHPELTAWQNIGWLA
ncbi:MAG: hypothetical protein J6Y92_00030 [Lentisphaeria bacterium]|nr:hypothetical protein [Lentisphaeria bacterium]